MVMSVENMSIASKSSISSNRNPFGKAGKSNGKKEAGKDVENSKKKHSLKRPPAPSFPAERSRAATAPPLGGGHRSSTRRASPTKRHRMEEMDIDTVDSMEDEEDVGKKKDE
jgi:hypothetical protein